jgi:acid stress-induced BolA-like protein IbaG/YrbA
MQCETIQALIETGLNGSVVIVDGDGRHFNAIVIYEGFANQSRIQKQQLVYAALGDRIANGTIHAISIKTFTPDEWQLHQKEL